MQNNVEYNRALGPVYAFRDCSMIFSRAAEGQKSLNDQRDLKLQKSQFMSNEILESSTSSISSKEEANMSCDVSEFNFNDENEPGPSCSKRKRGKRQFITSIFVAAFDKCKVSDRNAVHLLIATVEALNLELVINRASINRCHELLRNEHAQKSFEKFHEKKNQHRGVAAQW
ncbi:uncharacterized protein LOC126909614 [Daktulosphaira vitifoliae]|uniref:uncharacterized protein LOC126909614 n=1 Tax=Daktulosphaira vitifoliae TaxID=58002 RepID=UPI0021AA7805|nr:uncharacterized protein LOC126909614 [Daktulosphaira vitifoliae]